ncbi:MAG: DUF4838 domain-containing protein [Kiritimatiellae bacterium]|nr:DUF4838 domain-containing protein [Kiritimatiellia bacterium]
MNYLSRWGMVLAICALIVFGLGSRFVAGAEPGNLALVKDGKSQYAIVIPDAPTAQEKFAGEELAKYLKQISGVELPIKSDVAGRKIVVAMAKDGKGPGGINFTREEAEHDAFVIKTDGQDFYLIGSNKRGVIYAVYTLLEKYLGCRWAGFGERFQTEEQKKSGGWTHQIEEYVPVAKNISLSAINDRQQASFKYRGFVSYAYYGNTMLNNVDWAVKNKLNYFWIPIDQYDQAAEWREDIVKGAMVKRGAIIVAGHHAFYYFLNPDKYFKDHPDWFAMVGGKRVPGGRTTGQFCLSNPEAVKTFRENFIAVARKYPEVDIFAPIPNDGYGWCECELCTKDKVAWEERGQYQAVQDLYTAFANQLNEDVQKLYPGQGKRFGIAAYINYAQPPTKVKPPAGAFIMYSFFTRNWFTVPWGNAKGEDLGAGYPDRTAINSKFLKKWVELVKETGGDVTMGEYYAGRSAWKDTGFYLMRLISDELAYFRALGVTGAAVISGWSNRKTVPANLYVFAKNCWDTSLSTDAILGDYAKGRFGKAAEPMLKYLNEAERNSREPNKYGEGGAGKKAERNKSFEDCQKYLDEAKALADTEQSKKNLADEEANFKKLKAWQLK